MNFGQRKTYRTLWMMLLDDMPWLNVCAIQFKKNILEMKTEMSKFR